MIDHWKITCLLTTLLLVLPRPAFAQQAPKRTPVVAILNYGAEQDAKVAEFQAGLAALGYQPGRTLDIRYRWADGQFDRLPQLAAELVGEHPDLILAMGPAVWAVKPKTATIPILIAFSGNPVEHGVVESMARPGNNLTGFSLMSNDLAAKRVEMLKEAIPAARRIAVLFNPNELATVMEMRETEAAAARLNVHLVPLATRSAAEIETTVSAAKQQTEAMLVFIHGFAILNTARIVDAAARHGVPTLYGWREFAEAGGLLSYGPDVRLLVKRAAIAADKILKGVKPSDIPVEQPSRIELVVNARTAKALGLQLSPATLLRADEVIE